MRNVCIISNYNYGKYLKECLTSLTAQTLKFDLIIIVDDGSTDNSRDIINMFCGGCDYATSIFKENGGQLSCFNAVVQIIEPDDNVFLLDSDDIYPHDYLEHVKRINCKENADYVIVTPFRFKDGDKVLSSASIGPNIMHKFSSTSALTRRAHVRIGLETSCISMKGSLFKTILPYPFENDWRSCADDVLTIGSSIFGASKLFIESLSINYRIHSANQFAGRVISDAEHTEWNLRGERLFKWYSDKAILPVKVSLMNAIQEAILIPKNVRKRFLVHHPILIFLLDFIRYTSIVKLLSKNFLGKK